MDQRQGSDDEGTPETDGGRRGISRRRALGLGAAAAGTVAAGSLIRSGAAEADPPAYPVAPAGTTLATTLLHGTPGAKGYRPIVAGPGEPTLVRGDLLGGATRGAGTRTPLLAFTQFTDMHIIDAQSPARVEFTDRFNDPGSTTASVAPFSSAYRPWEMLTAQVCDAMVQSVNALSGGPVTGRPIDFTITTGDNSDNTQHNEVRWHIDIMDGGKTIRPDSGNTTKWEGVGNSADLDPSYWHPDGTPPLGSVDNYTGTYGYPTVPGLLDSCRRPFVSTGVRTPWYTVFGNHDGLVQGNIPSHGVLNAIAQSNIKVTGVPSGVNVQALLAKVQGGDTTALKTLFTAGPAKIVTRDTNRKLLTRKATVAEYFTTTGTPVGHGYTASNKTAGTAYYSFDYGNIHCISLDTVNPTGYDDGSIDKAQLTWLTAELNAHSSRHLDTKGNWVNGTGHDKLILIFSHHTVATMTNTLGTGRVTGTTVANLLLQYPNVVGWINGHTHVNSVTPHARAATAVVGGGFWEVNTASHVDWPQQSRILELVDNGDGTLSLFGTIVDHAAPSSWPANPTSVLELAALSRELAVNDPQRDAETAARDGKRGMIADRNVELQVKKPF